MKRFVSQKHEDKVPHMGWNTISQTSSSLFKGFAKEEFVYFVHSFYVPVNDCTAAVTDYILPFSAALHKDNYYATQFHPEKVEVWANVSCRTFWTYSERIRYLIIRNKLK